ncbi:MAG: amidohydrolase family protein, partial [Beijerinckiaceae bacterium]|nr:amidohydrolase family protein [Beijerinckiaceae bacterium]
AALTQEARAKAGGGASRVVDVHCHFFSDDLKAAWRQGGGHLPGNIANWTPAQLLEEMDRSGVAQSVLSLASAPLHWFKAPHEWRGLVRSVNDFGAQLVRDHKGRHAQFGFITCRDVEGSLREIEYAFDTLGVSGIEMATSFGDMWPGDPAFAPVFEELNRRKALVYFHPLAPFCCEGLVDGAHGSWIEYPLDTTRAIVSLLVNGAFRKYPDITFVFSHGGGVLPMLAHRIEALSRHSKARADIAPGGDIMNAFDKLYFETANATSAPALAALRAFTSADKLMFGSDFPYMSMSENLEGLRAGGFSADELRMVEEGNARRLIEGLE